MKAILGDLSDLVFDKPESKVLNPESLIRKI